MTKLYPNTIEGLVWGLKNFDAIEFDLRFLKDNKLAIFHDPKLEDGTQLLDLTLDQYKSKGFADFETLLDNTDIIEQSKKGKKFFMELKPNCAGKKAVRKDIVELFHNTFVNYIDNSNIAKESIYMLSFDKLLLEPFAREDTFPVYPIIPYINECNPRFTYIKAVPKILHPSLSSHIYDAVKKNYAGINFPREYYLGPFSKLHPSYEELCDLMDETGVELGTNLGTPDLEPEYPRFHRFTDKTDNFPRYRKEGEGLIVAHRGTGTKGIQLDDAGKS